MTPSLTAAAQAYAAGDPRRGARLFERASVEMRPLIRHVVRRHVEERDVEDVIQDALLRIWQAAETGRAAAIILYSTGAAVDHFRRNVRHEADELPLQLIDRKSIDDSLVPDLPLVASYAPQVWHDIVELAEADWEQGEIALKLDKAKSTVRRIATEIRDDYQLRKALSE